MCSQTPHPRVLQRFQNKSLKSDSTEQITKEWHESMAASTYKKVDMSSGESRRGISFVKIASKLLASTILLRSSGIRGRCTHENQAGFRAGPVVPIKPRRTKYTVQLWKRKQFKTIRI